MNIRNFRRARAAGLVRACSILCMLAIVSLAFGSTSAFAEGSRSLYPASYPSGGVRATLDVTGSDYLGGITVRR